MLNDNFHFHPLSRGALGAVVPSAVIALFLAGSPAIAQQSGRKSFASAREACKSLVDALQADDVPVLMSILGPAGKDLLTSGDPVEDKENREDFVKKYQQMHRLVIEPDGTTTLYIGAENWPTPISLVKNGNAWYFDTLAAEPEVLYRRIGRNELAVIQVCHELVAAEKEYYAMPHDGDSGKEYAARFYSDPDKHNGLYWEVSQGEPESPIGPFVALASAEGYADHPGRKQEPFQGYYFGILKAQGANAPGGARNYVTGGKMTGGVAFVAYPAEYQSSGVMTFIVAEDGIVYEKDQGPHTAEAAKAMTDFDPDASWHKVK